jgi:hypothetical protein
LIRLSFNAGARCPLVAAAAEARADELREALVRAEAEGLELRAQLAAAATVGRLCCGCAPASTAALRGVVEAGEPPNTPDARAAGRAADAGGSSDATDAPVALGGEYAALSAAPVGAGAGLLVAPAPQPQLQRLEEALREARRDAAELRRANEALQARLAVASELLAQFNSLRGALLSIRRRSSAEGSDSGDLDGGTCGADAGQMLAEHLQP